MENSKEDNNPTEISGISSSFDASERMLNFLLRDHLAKHQPPSFDSRILNRLRAREAGVVEPPTIGRNAPSFSSDELDEALGAAQADIEFGKETGNAGLDSYRSKSLKPADVSLLDFVWVRRLSALAILAAAVGFLYLGVRNLLPNSKDSSSVTKELVTSLPDNVSQEPQNTIPPSSLVETSSSPDTENRSPLASKGSPSTTITEKVPAADPSIPNKGANEEDSRFVISQPQAMEKQEFREVVNHQLSHMWSRMSVSPKLNTDLDPWLDRICEAAIGRMPTSAERQAFRNRNENTRLIDTVHEFIASDEFNIHWSTVLAEQYLGGPLPPSSNRSLELIQFVDWIETQLRTKRPIGNWERGMFETRPSVANASPSSGNAIPNQDSNSGFWLADRMRTAVLSVEGVEKFTKSKLHHSSKDAVAVSIARSLIHQSGNGLAACSQCHESDSSAIKNWNGGNRELDGNFWGISATLAQLAARPTSEGKLPSSELFYEASDGRMLIAKPSIAIASDPRKTLSVGDWIESSTSARFGMVETLWTKVVQQPLVPVFGLDESEGAIERQDMKDLFAKQLQATGDIRDVVEAILLSDVMKVPTANVTSSWYLKTPAETLAKFNQGKRMFAFVPNNLSRSYVSEQSSSNQIAKWLEMGREKETGLLAQPDARRLPNYGPKKGPVAWSDDQLRFMISVDRPYTGLEKMANTFSQSSLSWDDQINHVYLAVLGRFPSRMERNEAKELLDLAGQNTAKAIVYVITSKFGSW